MNKLIDYIQYRIELFLHGGFAVAEKFARQHDCIDELGCVDFKESLVRLKVVRVPNFVKEIILLYVQVASNMERSMDYNIIKGLSMQNKSNDNEDWTMSQRQIRDRINTEWNW